MDAQKWQMVKFKRPAQQCPARDSPARL